MKPSGAQPLTIRDRISVRGEGLVELACWNADEDKAPPPDQEDKEGEPSRVNRANALRLRFRHSVILEFGLGRSPSFRSR